MLLASDFDDTLFVENNEQLLKNINSIKKFRKKGNIFVIITGRGYESIKKQVELLNIEYDYLVCGCGSAIYDNKDNMLYAEYLDKETVNRILDIVNENNCSFVVDTGSNYIDNSYDNIEKIVSIYVRKDTIINKEEFIKYIDKETNTYNYYSKKWLCITSISTNKKEGLKSLVNIINFNKDIYVIGDAVNDIPMIKEYNGAIMNNHDIELDELDNKKYNSLSEYIGELI